MSLSTMKTAVIQDPYVYEMAAHSVAWFNGEYYFVVADLPAGDDVKPHIPAHFPLSRVKGGFSTRIPRRLLFRIHIDRGRLIGDFVVASAVKAEIVLKNNPEEILMCAREFADDAKVELCIEISSQADEDAHAYFDPETKTVYIEPDAFYRHASRSLVFQGLNMEDVVAIVLSHEFGHALDEEVLKVNHEFDDKTEYFNTEMKRLASQKSFTDDDLSFVESLFPLASEVLGFQIDREIRASDIGKQFIPDHLTEHYENDKWRNAQSYVESAKQVVNSLESLRAHMSRTQWLNKLKRGAQ